MLRDARYNFAMEDRPLPQSPAQDPSIVALNTSKVWSCSESEPVPRAIWTTAIDRSMASIHQVSLSAHVYRQAWSAWPISRPGSFIMSSSSVRVQNLVTDRATGTPGRSTAVLGCSSRDDSPGSGLTTPVIDFPSLSSVGDCILELLGTSGRGKSVFADEAERSVASVAHRCGMARHAFDTYSSLGTSFSSFMYSAPATAERLAAVCLHQSLFLLLDDLCFDMDPAHLLHPEAYGIQRGIHRSAPARVVEYLRDLNLLFRTHQLPPRPTPIQRAIWLVGTELRRLSTPHWFHLFADAFEDYVAACIALQADAGRSAVRDLHTYAGLRYRNSGALHIALLMEVATDVFPPETVRNHSSIQKLVQLYGEITPFVNDIFSYHKDVLLEGSRFNLIDVLMHTEGLPFQRAVQRAVDLVTSKIREFAVIESSLPVWESQSVDRTARRYVLLLKEVIAGYYLWHSSSSRYRSPDSPFPELRILTPNL